MTSRTYTAITPEGIISLLGKGTDEPSRRANAIATIHELWPDLKLLQLQPATDW